MTKVGFYPGSFDPVTFGHLDIIARAAELFDRLVIGVGVHHGKQALLDDTTRVSLLRSVISDLSISETEVEIVTFDTLTVSAAHSHDAQAIVRGLRDGTDFDYEMQMFGTNHKMQQDIDTLFLPASVETRFLAAKFVRQIAKMGGDITPFVPQTVANTIKKKLS
ncbi:MAG: pantetheine-phosphate adenylyltransferase [Methyloligellaceae bacterium]